jgi:hypothetical protein
MAEKNNIKGTCKGCGADIIWLQSPKTGKFNVPVNPEGVEDLDIFFNYRKHVSHFATCSKADELRRKSKGNRGKVKNAEATGMMPSVEQIIRERQEIYDDFANKLAKDKRGFIANNKLPITMRRYSLLNRAAELGMEYEYLISYSSNELIDWICENDSGTGEETAASLRSSQSEQVQEGLFG